MAREGEGAPALSPLQLEGEECVVQMGTKRYQRNHATKRGAGVQLRYAISAQELRRVPTDIQLYSTVLKTECKHGKTGYWLEYKRLFTAFHKCSPVS